MSYLNLEHKILKKFRSEELPKKLLIAVSGGQDSMALLTTLLQLKAPLGLELKVAHIHHGFSSLPEIMNFRNEAYDQLQAFCKECSIDLLSNFDKKSGSIFFVEGDELTSEDQLRSLRESFYQQWLHELPDFTLALAHHQQDVLENRLIQMIRGCGVKGFQSMALKGLQRIRPFIDISKAEIQQYCLSRSVHFVCDPSNSSLKYLRNWIRNQWLPELEAYKPGSVSVLSQSLNHLSAELTLGKSHTEQEGVWAKVYNAEGQSLRCVQLLGLNHTDKYKVLMQFFSLQGANNFGKNHLDEVVKRLDNRAKEHRFSLLKKTWCVRNNELFLETKND